SGQPASTAPGQASSGLFPGSGIGGHPAVGAAAEDGEVADVGLEAVAFLQCGDQRVDGVGADLGDPAAVAADQVHVGGVAGPVLGGRPVPEVGVGDHADLLEQFERAVDGRDV